MPFQNIEQLNETLGISMIVSILNQKYAENHESPEKSEILTEVLNEIKLHLMQGPSQELH